MKIEFGELDKMKITDLVYDQFVNSGFNQSEYARTLGFKAEDMSNLFRKNWLNRPGLIGMNKWVRFARVVGFSKHADAQWVTAETEVYTYINNQLGACQRESLTAILVDEAGIGKTWACKAYQRQNKAVFYIDGSVNGTKSSFIRALGRAVGVGDHGKIDEVLNDAIYALESMDRPLLILDEAGDLDNGTLLVLKRMYNALDTVCGFYMVGADGLKHRLERGIRNKRMGYVEFFSRYGKEFKKVLPVLANDRYQVLKEMAAAIAIANGIEADATASTVNSLSKAQGFGDMRGVKRKIMGIKANRNSTTTTQS
ncbi:MAG: ATP-binding protein [Pedobacter sp.]|nr:MAG: ATP-binding protein [Pedobacter sp.]